MIEFTYGIDPSNYEVLEFLDSVALTNDWNIEESNELGRVYSKYISMYPADNLVDTLFLRAEGTYGTKHDILFEEYFHYYQAIHKGFGGLFARGLYEQIRRRFGGVDPYKTPGNLEYGAFLFRCVYGTAQERVCN